MGYIRKFDNLYNIVGKNLKRIRLENNLSQQALCNKLELLGVEMLQNDIYEIENNKRFVKDFELKAFSFALNVSILDFFTNTDVYFK